MSTTTNTEEKDKQLTVEGAVGNTLTPAQIEAGKQMYADIQAGYDEQYEAMEKAQNDSLALEKKAIENEKKKLDDAAHDEMQKAYTDYERETSKYGVNAEAMAASGMSRTGYSESSRVRAYAAYQNRVATTKAALASAKSDCDLEMQKAILQNNVALAQIAFSSFQQRTELLISQFNAGLYEYDGLDDQTDEGTEETPPFVPTFESENAPFYVNGKETPSPGTTIFNPKSTKYGPPQKKTYMDEGMMLVDAYNSGEYEEDKSNLSKSYTDEELANAIDAGDVVVYMNNDTKQIVYNDRPPASEEEAVQRYGIFGKAIYNTMNNDQAVSGREADAIADAILSKSGYNMILGKNKLPQKYRNYTWEEIAEAVRSGELIGERNGKNIVIKYPNK